MSGNEVNATQRDINFEHMRGLLAYLMDLTFLFHSLLSTTLFNPFISIFSLQRQHRTCICSGSSMPVACGNVLWCNGTIEYLLIV